MSSSAAATLRQGVNAPHAETVRRALPALPDGLRGGLRAVEIDDVVSAILRGN